MAPRAPRASEEPDFQHIREVLTRAVRKACPAHMASQVDDIVQHAVTRLVARARESEGGLQVGSAYLWKVANHAVIDEIRRRRTRKEEPMPEDREAGAGRLSDPERAVRDRQITAGIEACLTGVSPNRRAAVGLYLQGLSVPEVARALHHGPKRAENLVYRGLTDLRKCLLAKGLRP